MKEEPFVNIVSYSAIAAYLLIAALLIAGPGCSLIDCDLRTNQCAPQKR